MNPNTTLAIQHEIEQFLYREGSLLDDGKFEAWLELFTDDLHYFVPVRETLENAEHGVLGVKNISLINDNKNDLTQRILRLGTGLAHAETPRSRTRHNINNVMIETAGNEYRVRCNIQISVSRLEKTEFNFYGCRYDSIRRSDTGLKISQRKVILDQTLLPRAISVLF